MATFNKFNSFVAYLANGGINAGSDSLKVMLGNVAPAATDTTYASISGTKELASGNGYTTGGTASTLTSSSQTSGTYKLILQNVVWTATGSMGPFRYATLYDSVSGDLIGWWDYGSSITLNSGDTFTWTPDGTNGVFQLV